MMMTLSIMIMKKKIVKLLRLIKFVIQKLIQFSKMNLKNNYFLLKFCIKSLIVL